MCWALTGFVSLSSHWTRHGSVTRRNLMQFSPHSHRYANQGNGRAPGGQEELLAPTAAVPGIFLGESNSFTPRRFA